jgi:hypothetical protein
VIAVWKFPLLITDHQSIPMPACAVPLSVGMQFGAPQVWAQVDTTKGASQEPVHIRIAGTGHPMGSAGVVGRRFLGTLITDEGRLVWHVFHETRS